MKKHLLPASNIAKQSVLPFLKKNPAASFGSQSTTKSTTPDDKSLQSAAPKKRNAKMKEKELYSLPKCYELTHDHGSDGKFKDGKANIWLWNLNGVNA
jgi:hypothetical protein